MKIYYLLFIFLILGCASSKKVSDSDIVGKYSYKGIYGIGSTIDFNRDKTFVYNWVGGLIGGSTKGTWSVSGKKIILNSERKKSDVIKFKILESSDNNSAFYKLKFLDENKDILPKVICLLVKESGEIKELDADFDGKLQVSKDEDFQKVRFIFLGYHEFEIKKEDLNGNVTLMMFQKETYYQYFENEVMIFKGDKIYTDLIKKARHVKNDFFTKID
jgi:hypothetical protein